MVRAAFCVDALMRGCVDALMRGCVDALQVSLRDDPVLFYFKLLCHFADVSAVA